MSRGQRISNDVSVGMNVCVLDLQRLYVSASTLVIQLAVEDFLPSTMFSRHRRRDVEAEYGVAEVSSFRVMHKRTQTAVDTHKHAGLHTHAHANTYARICTYRLTCCTQ
jgi:hypothetical protein